MDIRLSGGFLARAGAGRHHAHDIRHDAAQVDLRMHSRESIWTNGAELRIYRPYDDSNESVTAAFRHKISDTGKQWRHRLPRN